MSRLTTLNTRLRPWVTIEPNREEFLNSLPANIWDKILKDSEKLGGLSRYWFLSGILRAITEMERKAADGTPFYRSRQELIDHLKSIDRP
jgi:hypothetical protein